MTSQFQQWVISDAEYRELVELRALRERVEAITPARLTAWTKREIVQYIRGSRPLSSGGGDAA